LSYFLALSITSRSKETNNAALFMVSSWDWRIVQDDFFGWETTGKTPKHQ
jgi:hypothetical protein